MTYTGYLYKILRKSIELLIIFLQIVEKHINLLIFIDLNQFTKRELPEEQAGFRAGRGTRDLLFVLQLLIEKTVSLDNRALYMIFIDYSKAFDTVDHENKLALELDVELEIYCLSYNC